MACPDFLCMGFQKCGTTTLHGIFRQHPQIALCRDVKEPMYYRVPIMSFIGRGNFYYRHRYFGHLSPEDPRLRGEINAGLTYTFCVKRMRGNIPKDTKMIFMLRNPITRSFSAYKYFLARGFLPIEMVGYDQEHGHAEGFDHYVHWVLDNPTRRKEVMKKQFKYMALSQSNYGYCIRAYLDDYSLENMRFVIFEEFVKDQHKACLELYDFLGIEDDPDIDYDIRLNEGAERSTDGKLSRQFMVIKGLNHFLLDLMGLEHWAPKLSDRFIGYYNRKHEACLVEDTDTSKPLPETRAYLTEYFLPDILETEALTKRDLQTLWGLDSPA